MRVKIQVLVGIAVGFLLMVAFGKASADEQSSSTLAVPEVELAPAAVVAAGADSVDLNAVARLTTYGPLIQRGTAFQLDDGRVVTVAHALVDARRASLGEDQTTQSLPIFGDGGEALAATSRLHDLSAVKGDHLPSSMPVATTAPVVGDSVSLAGFPEDGRVATVSGTIIARTSGVDYGFGRPDVLVLSAEVDRGWSGGPVVNGDGEVIGVIVGREQQSGVTIAVPIDYVPVP